MCDRRSTAATTDRNTRNPQVTPPLVLKPNRAAVPICPQARDNANWPEWTH